MTSTYKVPWVRRRLNRNLAHKLSIEVGEQFIHLLFQSCALYLCCEEVNECRRRFATLRFTLCGASSAFEPV